MVKRFEEILKRIPNCETLLDVGCDHGYISFEALKRSIASSVICSDISAPSLEKAKRLIGDQGTYYVADGIPEGVDFDFLLIAGMGGREIMKILKNRPAVKALFQPMKNVDVLRDFLVSNGYRIVSDEIIFDGKYYNIIVTDVGEDSLSEDELLFGRTNLVNKSCDFISYLNCELKKTSELIECVSGKRKQELESYFGKIVELLKNDN